MTIQSTIQSIRVWGIKGVWDYFANKHKNRRKRQYLLANARRYPLVPKRGVTILADMTNKSSLSKAMRDFAFALHKAGIPFQTFDLNPQSDLPDTDLGKILTPPKQFRLLKYDHVIEMFSSPLPDLPSLKRAKIVFWEFTTGLLEYDPSIGKSKTIIAMSDFDRDVFKQILPKTINIQKIVYPFFFAATGIPDKKIVRRKYGLPNDAFIVFYNFDYGSSFYRKNPEGCVRAFAAAFVDERRAMLVFKTKGAAKHVEARSQLLNLAESLGIGKRMVMIDDYITQHDIYGLTEACDVYLSLHRGEGFGLGIAEAMSLGKPVVVTDYSSTTEFCLPHTSMPVACSLVKVPNEMHDHPCYHAVQEWAEPDIKAAAAALRKLYSDPSLRSRIGSAAKAFLEEHFSIENFRKSVEAFLQQ